MKKYIFNNGKFALFYVIFFSISTEFYIECIFLIFVTLLWFFFNPFFFFRKWKEKQFSIILDFCSICSSWKCLEIKQIGLCGQVSNDLIGYNCRSLCSHTNIIIIQSIDWFIERHYDRYIDFSNLKAGIQFNHIKLTYIMHNRYRKNNKMLIFFLINLHEISCGSSITIYAEIS